jgi:hypothetical protein
MYLSGTNTLGFATNGTLDMVLDANGALGIGSSSLTGFSLLVGKNLTGGTSVRGISQEGFVQSDATTAVYGIRNVTRTATASFTISDYQHFLAVQATLGAGSSITNQYGFVADSTLISGVNNYGFYGNIPAASNRWNLYMNGTANNYMAGSLGIGSTSLSLFGLRVSKTITGGTIAYNQFNDGSVQSDVTSEAMYYSTNATTAAAAFTLTNLFHYRARYNVFGAGSAVTNQYGFFVDSTLTAATNNYAFYSSIPSGTNRWNLYMAGSAANYMAGNLAIGSTNTTYSLDVNGVINTRGSSSIAGSGLSMGYLTSNYGWMQSFGSVPLVINASGNNVVIGGTSSNASARLQVDSTTQGFLPPRMTTTQKLAIGTPAAGLMVYDTTLNQMSYYNGTLWINF